MITSQKAMQIMFEPDAGKRDAIIDALSEQSAKDLLKICLKIVSEQMRGTKEEQR